MAGLLPLLDDRWMRHLHLETGRDLSVLYKEINISDLKKKKKKVSTFYQIMGRNEFL